MSLILKSLRVCLVHAVFLSFWINITTGDISIQLIPPNPRVRHAVTMSVKGISEQFRECFWYNSSEIQANYQIAFYINGNKPSENEQLKLFENCSLQIKNLSKKKQGYYTVTVQLLTSLAQATKYLPVYEIVTKPVIKPSSPYAVENKTLILTCSTENAEQILWSKDNGNLPSGVILSSNNLTVNFTKIKLSDEGNYQCEAVNPASSNTSDKYNLIVHYGPMNISIVGMLHVKAGSPFSLICAADSFPKAIYNWLHNGSNLNKQEDTLHIVKAGISDEGNYTCEGRNTITQRSDSFTVYVNVTMTAENIDPPTSLAVGTIAGIVVAVVLLIIALLVAILYLYFIRRKHVKSPDNINQRSNAFPTRTAENSQTAMNGAGMGETEIQYISLDFHPRRNPKTQPVPETTVYAEVKRS